MRRRMLNVWLRYCARPILRFGRSPERQAWAFDLIGPRLFPGPPFNCHLTEKLNELTLHWVSIGKTRSRGVILYLHGGAYIAGSGTAYHGLLGRLSQLTGLQVCAPDYRLLHQARFPAAFEDALQTWEALLAKGYRPGDIVLGGDSAGAGLMLSLLAHLTQQGIRPRACFALSPWTDMTLQGDSLQSDEEVLLPVTRMTELVHLYLDGAAPDDPRASPLFARYDKPPPVLIQVGRGEALYDDALRMAAVLGDAAQLRVWDGVPHVWQIFDGYIPQARAALREIADFIHTSFAMDSR